MSLTLAFQDCARIQIRLEYSKQSGLYSTLIKRLYVLEVNQCKPCGIKYLLISKYQD